jgi:hypothetical protein
MKVDRIDNKVFDDPVSTPSPSSGLDLNTPDPIQSLSSPFRNPYGNVGNFAGSVSKQTNGTKKGLTAAERNNNPFNIKFGKFAAKYGATKEDRAALDGGSFATFPTVDAGFAAAKDLLKGNSYRSLTVDQAMKRWSNKGYGGEIYPEIAGVQIAQLNDNQLSELQRRQIVREDRNFAKKIGMLNTNLPKYKFGGYLPKMASGGLVPLNSRPYLTNNQLASGLGKYTTQQQLGNIIQQNTPTSTVQPNSGGGVNAGLVSAGLGLAGEGVAMFDSNPNKVNQTANVGAGILKGAAAGATVGSIIPGWGTAVGAVVGGAVGGVTSAIKGNKRKKEIVARQAADQRLFNENLMNRSAQAYRQYQPYQYKFGGNTGVEPTFEVEKDEVIQGNPILEEGTELGGGLHLVGGKKHSQGGTLGAGEGRVFSNSISFTGGTPAKQAKRIGNQLKKFETNLSSKDHMKRITAEAMTDKLNTKLNDLYEAQEQYKMLPQFKYGGQLPKFADGGTVNEKREAVKRRIKTLDNYLKNNPKRQAVGGYDAKDDLRKERSELQKQLDNPAIWKGDVFNPLDRTKNVAFPQRNQVGPTDDVAWTNDLKPVNIRGKKTIVPSKPVRKVQSQITRNDFGNIDPLIPKPIAIDNNLDEQIASRNGDEIFNRINQDKFKTTPVAPNSRRKGMGLNFKDVNTEQVLPLALSTAGYLNSARRINMMNTDAPANMIDSPYYGYIDRSRLARHDLQSFANATLRNPNLNAGRRQAIFAGAAGAMNQINDQENSNRFAYDNDYANRAFQVNAQNNAILNQAQAQRIANQNAQQGLRSQNFSSYLGNINTGLAENEARNLDERKFKVISDSYRRQYGTNFDVTLQ